jgi:hypothetical protein
MKIYRVNWWHEMEQSCSAHFSNRKEAVKFLNWIRRENKVDCEIGALDEIDILEIKMPITRSELIRRLNFAGNGI